MKEPPLILLPGLLSNQTLFQHQINYLKDVVDILVIDLTDVDSPDAMTNKILRLAPKHFMLAGHSIGGWVALRIMKIAPERISKLFIMNTSARGIEPDELAARQLVLKRIAKGEFPKIAAEIVSKFTFNKSVQETVMQMFLQAGKQALTYQTKAMMVREDLREILPAISCPTQVVHAEQDQRFSFEMLKEVSQLIPHSTLKMIPQCGHMSPIERPEAISDLMRDWIKSGNNVL